jgi:AcrR family transcriptional regulator
VVSAEGNGRTSDRQIRILGAATGLLARDGIGGVSMRAVAREAGVSLGLVNYHFEDKASLIRAVLHRVESQDLAMVELAQGLSSRDRLLTALRQVAKPEFLTTEYLSLRLQLWALARAHPDYEKINTQAQRRYRAAIAGLLREARPDLSATECRQRAADIDVIQNGVWLTALLGLDQASIRRSINRCEHIAFG